MSAEPLHTVRAATTTGVGVAPASVDAPKSTRSMDSWPETRQHLAPRPGDTDVWRIALPSSWDTTCDHLLGLLDEGERGRAGNMVRERDRVAFVVAHGALRDILGHRLDLPPSSLRFRVGRYGKPYLADTRLSFSLSHTHGSALVAASAQGPVGVDIERATGADFSALADRFFTAREASAVREAADSGRPSRFLAYWTCKESFVKALGLGLSQPLDRFEIRFAGAPRRAEVWSGGRRREEWHVRQLPMAPSCFAAVTVRGPLARLRTWAWNPRATHRAARPSA